MTEALDEGRGGDWAEQFDRAYERLTGAVLHGGPSDGEALLREIAATLGLLQVACERFEADQAEPRAVTSLTTYPKAWRTRYAARRYAAIDPVAMVGMYARHPFDWRSFRIMSPQVQAFLADAAAHGLGTSGLTVPLDGGGGDVVLVSFTSGMDPDRWDAYRRRCLTRLRILACLISVVAARSAARIPKTAPGPERAPSSPQRRFA